MSEKLPKSAILCVDDELTVLQSLRITLKNYFGNSYLYEIAESTDEAMEIMEELELKSVSLVMIISDWLMPDMRGDEFLIQVHNKSHPHIVKILMTAQADPEAIARAKKDANLYDCIAKPWNEQVFIQTIKSGLK